MNAAVVGSGVGGLAIAIRLANKGYSVTLYEKNTLPGGKISQIERQGYRFDTGPSLFTLPDLIEDLFRESGEELCDYMSYSLLENNCKYFFRDGSQFVFYHDKDQLRAEVESKTSESYHAIAKRLHDSEEIYNISAPVFIFSNFHKLSNFNTPPYKNIALKLGKLNFLSTMHGANKRDFKDPRIVQLFDRYATYNGSEPYRAPATLNMIAHLENNIGAFFPENGMYGIVDSLYRLAMKRGVKFEFNSLVSKIVVEAREVKGVVVNGQMQDYDIVVSDADVKYLVNNLMDSPLENRVNRSEPSSSALIFYWGVKRQFDQLDIHNILFSGDYKKEFDTIFKAKSLTDDPTVYICVSSKVVKSDAPEGCENWFVMINTPSDSGQNWSKLIAEAREKIIKKINETLHTDIESVIECEEVRSPLEIEKYTMSANGALYGAASNSMFSAFMRHPNMIASIKNLYFVGGSVHPGGGIPLCLAGAAIVDSEIKPLKQM